jgi:putative tricarboxylic transport membrane protein
MVLGVILGPLAESSFMTMMVSNGNDWTVLMGRPVSATVMVMAVVALVYPIQRQLRERTRRNGTKQ